MTALSERLCRRYFAGAEHPYDAFEREVARALPAQGTLVDAGCGRTAPVLVRFRGRAARLIGIDVVDFTQRLDGIELYQRSLADTGLESGSVDLVMARSVMEHISDPIAVYGEVARVLRPGGRFVFLTANLWDYASLIAAAIPNRLHPWIVAHAEGRREEDVFPIEYQCNTRRAISRAAAASALRLERFEYLGQYPAYFMFNGALFFLATWYERTIAAIRPLNCLRGWILCTLSKTPLASEGHL